MKPIVVSGKRKTAIAKATIRKGLGRVRINKLPLEFLEPELARLKIMEPIYLAGDKINTVDIDVNVKGGGVMGQAAASRTAIAKALVSFLDDKKLETLYRTYDRSLLVDDVRRKLPKKPCGRGARKKRQKSYR